MPPVLGPVQQAVVAHTGGPLLVIGGPGTGKTTTVVEAVAARVAGGADPERVLVLTFGRRAAGALRHRIAARVTGPAGRALPEPLVRTFHGYAFGLLRRAAARRGEPAPRLLTGPEQDLVIRELLAGGGAGWPERLQAALPTRGFAAQLRDLLLRAAERGIDPAGLEELAAKCGRDDWRSAAGFRQEYDQVLALRDSTGRGATGYDYAELVRAAAGLLAGDPALLAAERRKLAAIYVDEFADTDPAQRELLELVAGRGGPLVAFADPDSATFGFRGGDPDGVRQFPERFPTAAGQPAPSLTLTGSYRAGPELLAATARVGRRLRGPAGHRQLAPAGGDRPAGLVQVHTFRSPVSEHAWLAHRLRELHLRESVGWSAMAVLVRAGRQLARVQRALRAARIPVVIHAEDLPLAEQPAVAPLLRLLRCALDPARLDEEAAVALLHSPLGGADPFTERQLRQGLRALARSGGDPRPSGELLVDALQDPAELAMVDRRWAAPARAVARLLATARQAAAAPGATAEEVLWQVWRAAGLADRWFAAVRSPGEDSTRAEAADRDLDAMVVLFDAAARFTDRLPGAGVEVFLDHVQGQQLPADTLAPTADRGEAVRLLTAHAAKGLEWDVVAIPGVQEGVWPDLRLRGSLLGSEQLVDLYAGRDLGVVGQTSALLDEERRLFHVAVSRASRVVLVSAVAAATVGVGEQPEEPSRFLRELAGSRQLADGAELTNVDESGRVPRGLTLPALAAELRTAVADPASGYPRRQAAAAQLARLAAAGVRGAHPDQWWGLARLSDDRPLVDEGEPVRVTPSAMESALRCSLRWLLERHGGAAPATAAQGVGNLVHATAMLADRASVDREALLDWLDGRFDAIEHAARWLAGPERERAEAMVDKLVRWVAANPRRLLAIEQDFVVELGQVQLRGRVDRLELDESGRLVVVDLKTGKSSPTAAEIAEHPQLGAYQAAVEAGGFPEHGTDAGGAALVQLGTPAGQAREQVQPPLLGTEDRGWAVALVRRTGQVMAAASFTAVRNDRCRVCPVRTSCPITGQGRQVVEP